MRRALLAAFLGSTAFAAVAVAQGQPSVTPDSAPEGQVRAKAAIAECDRLIAFLDSSRPTAGVTVDQARTWQRESDAASCKTALDRITQASAPPAPAATAQAGPSSAPAAAGAPPATATPAVPQVVVQQAQPSVTVRQARPEIIVRMPPPIITVQQPQPEIIVRMPEPDVNVAVARPEVQVTIPQPQIQVQPPSQQSQVNVQVERQEPNVRIERIGEPRIVYQPAEGQPQIRFEPVDSNGQGGVAAQSDGRAAPVAGLAPAGAGTPAVTEQMAQAQLNNPRTEPNLTSPQVGYGTHSPAGAARAPTVEPHATGALTAGATQPLPVSRLSSRSLYNAREEKLGDVESVVTGPEGRTFVIVSHGGFLGLGEKRVAVPLEQVALKGDRLVTDTLSDDELKALPAFERSSAYRALQGDQAAQVRTLR